MAVSIGTTKILQGLLDRAAGGDAQANGQLLERASERLMHMARMMLRKYPHLQRWEQTDDVFQNAMIRLHRSLSEVRPDSVRGFFGLAATQIRRTLIDLVRHHFGPEGSAVHHESDMASRPSRAAVPNKSDDDGPPATLDEWADFHEAVQNLPDESRDVFDLLWYGGMQQQEVAAMLGVSVPTVQRRWYKARTALYDALQGEGPGDSL